MTYYTEEEARGRWCPFGRMLSSGNQGSFNRNSYDQGTTKCLGSKCMMWKWFGRDGEDKFITGRCGY